MNSAASVPSGTAITTAMTATNTVPDSRPSTPISAGSHRCATSIVVRKWMMPICSNARRLRRRSREPDEKSSTSTVIPDGERDAG